MGYVNVTDITQYISPFMYGKSAGTWTPTLSSNKLSDVRTAADASFTLTIPILLPGSVVGNQGAMLKSIDFWYNIGVADADDFATVTLVKLTLPVNGAAPSAATPSVTLDVDHDTAAERRGAESHKMTVTLDTPVFIDTKTFFYLVLIVDAAATSVFSNYGAQANFILRL